MGKYDVGTIHQNLTDNEFKIIEYIDGKLRKIRFTLSENERIVSLSSLSKNNSQIIDSCNELYAVGKMFVTNEDCNILITEIISVDKRKIIFLDYENLELIVNRSAIKSGSIKNPYKPSVCGVGYLGGGEYKASKYKKQNMNYKLWIGMLRRVYDIDNKTYRNVTVCDEWHNFQNFAKWYEENYPYNIKYINFQIDKDLMQEGIKNKIYSPKTCIFLPQKINSYIADRSLKNTSGFVGVTFEKYYKKYRAIINDFDSGKSIHLGYFKTPEEASQAYQIARAENAEKAKQYLRDLNYLPEEIIQLIK